MSKQQTEAHNIFRNSLRNDIDLSKIRTLNANESKLDNNTSNQSEKPLFIKKERIQLPDRYTIKIDKKNYKQSYVLEPDKGIQPSRSYYNRGASSTAQKNNITKNYNTINDSSFPYNERLTTQKLQDQILKENNNFIKVVRRKDFNSYFHRKEYFLDTE